MLAHNAHISALIQQFVVSPLEVLAHVTKSHSVHAQFSGIAYMKASDIWLTACFTNHFLVLWEFILAHGAGKLHAKQVRTHLKQQTPALKNHV